MRIDKTTDKTPNILDKISKFDNFIIIRFLLISISPKRHWNYSPDLPSKSISYFIPMFQCPTKFI